MAKTGYVNARIDNTLKDRAEKIFGQIGVSSSQALTMFYRQVVMRRGMPFDVSIPNQTTRRAMAEADAGGGVSHAGSTGEMFDQILKPRRRHEARPRQRHETRSANRSI